jgi:hypothetical protein
LYTVRRKWSCDADDGHLIFSPPLYRGIPVLPQHGLPSISLGGTPMKDITISSYIMVNAAWDINTDDIDRLFCAWTLGESIAQGAHLSLCIDYQYQLVVTFGASTSSLYEYSGTDSSFFGQWYQITVVFESKATTGTGSSRLSIYRDGTAVPSMTVTNSVDYVGSNLLTLGAGPLCLSAWIGGIDEVRVYSRVLSHAEIWTAQPTNRWPTDAALQVYYAFAQEDARDITDQSGRGRHTSYTSDAQIVWEAPYSSSSCTNNRNHAFTISPDPQDFYTDCPKGGASDGSHNFLAADGNCGVYLNADPSAGGFLSNGQAITISVWVRRITYSDAGDSMFVWSVGKPTPSAPGETLSFGFMPSSPVTFTEGDSLQDGNEPFITDIDSSLLAPVSTTSEYGLPFVWEQYTVSVLPGATGVRTIFRNGEQLISQPGSIALSLDNSATHGPYIVIGGQRTQLAACERGLNGMVDEFKMYVGWAASPSQIATMWWDGVWPYSKELVAAYGFYEPTSDTGIEVTDDSGHGRKLTYAAPVERYDSEAYLCLPAYAVVTNVPAFLFVGEAWSVDVHFTQQVSLSNMSIEVKAAYNNTDVSRVDTNLYPGQFIGPSGQGITLYKPYSVVFTPERVDLQFGKMFDLVPQHAKTVSLPPTYAASPVTVSVDAGDSSLDFYHFKKVIPTVWTIPVVYELWDVRFQCYNAERTISFSPKFDVPFNSPRTTAPIGSIRTAYSLTVGNRYVDKCKLTIVTHPNGGVFRVQFDTGSQSDLSNGGTNEFSIPDVDAPPLVISISRWPTQNEPTRTITLQHIIDMSGFDVLASSSATTQAAGVPLPHSPDFIASTRSYTASTSFDMSYISFQGTFVIADSLSFTYDFGAADQKVLTNPDGGAFLSNTWTSKPLVKVYPGQTTLVMHSKTDADLMVLITRSHDVTNVTIAPARLNLLTRAPRSFNDAPITSFLTTPIADGGIGLSEGGGRGGMDLEDGGGGGGFLGGAVSLDTGGSRRRLLIQDPDLGGEGFIPIGDPTTVGSVTLGELEQMDFSSYLASGNDTGLISSYFSPDIQEYAITKLPFSRTHVEIVVTCTTSDVLLTNTNGSHPMITLPGLPTLMPLSPLLNILSFNSSEDNVIPKIYIFRAPPVLTDIKVDFEGVQLPMGQPFQPDIRFYMITQQFFVPSNETLIRFNVTVSTDASDVVMMSSLIDGQNGSWPFMEQAAEGTIGLVSFRRVLKVFQGTSVYIVINSEKDGEYMIQVEVLPMPVSSSSTAGMEKSSTAGGEGSSTAGGEGSSTADGMSSTVASSASPFYSSSTGVFTNITIVAPSLPPTPEFLVAVPPSVDPCASRALCVNGGICKSTPVLGAPKTANGDLPVSLSCTCPLNTYGPHCPFTIIGCAGCTSNYAGGSTVRIVGSGFGYIRSLSVYDSTVFPRASKISLAQAMTDESIARILNTNTREFTSESGIEILSFETPSLVDYLNRTSQSTELQEYFPQHSQLLFSQGEHMAMEFATGKLRARYEPLSVHLEFEHPSEPFSHDFKRVNYTSLLYYTSNTCLNESQFLPDGLGGCLKCPTGAYCVGGTVTH